MLAPPCRQYSTSLDFLGCLGQSIAAIFRQILNRFSDLPQQMPELTYEARYRKASCKLINHALSNSRRHRDLL
jgi:hypothetical protein